MTESVVVEEPSRRRHPTVLYHAMLEEIRANRFLTEAERNVAVMLVEAVGSGRVGLSGLDTVVTYAFGRLREVGFTTEILSRTIATR